MCEGPRRGQPPPAHTPLPAHLRGGVAAAVRSARSAGFDPGQRFWRRPWRWNQTRSASWYTHKNTGAGPSLPCAVIAASATLREFDGEQRSQQPLHTLRMAAGHLPAGLIKLIFSRGRHLPPGSASSPSTPRWVGHQDPGHGREARHFLPFNLRAPLSDAADAKGDEAATPLPPHHPGRAFRQPPPPAGRRRIHRHRHAEHV